MINFIKIHIPKQAELIALLTLLTEKGVKFEWSQEAKNALTKCKAAVAEAYIPKFPDLNKLFEPFTDACNFAVWAVLVEEDSAYFCFNKITQSLRKSYCPS